MADYDNKLGEWFKQVEQQEQALKAKKTVGGSEDSEEPKPTAAEPPRVAQVSRMEIEGPAREASASVVATVETVEVVADTSLAGAIDQPERNLDDASLFDAEEAPPVEDFFSFLSRSSDQPVVEEVEDRVFELPKEQGSLGLSEGTGEARPLAAEPEPPAPAPQPVEAPLMQVIPQVPTPPKPVVPRVDRQPKVEAPVSTQENWDRMPRHLQTLFGAQSQEVAQNSYKAFKETREDLIQRLLDPTVSLEEAARVLNVCPTTVRRYTNRGVLRHYRTAGNQRRFKLSDVLVFMESGQRRGSADEVAADGE